MPFTHTPLISRSKAPEFSSLRIGFHKPVFSLKPLMPTNIPDMQNIKYILDRLRNLRIKKGMRQDQVAKVLGVSRTTYVRKEQGSIPITTEEWVKLADSLGKEPDYFFSLLPDGEKESLLLRLYRALTPEEKGDFLSAVSLVLKRVGRKNIAQALEKLKEE